MISKVTVFHRGGAVLWTSDEESASTADPADTPKQTPTDSMTDTRASSAVAMQLAINRLIQTVLLSDKSASDSMVHDAFTLKWSFENKFNLVFVAVFYSFQKLLFVDEFLEMVNREFIRMFAASLEGGVSNLTQQDYTEFYAKYQRIEEYFKRNRSSNRKAPKTFANTKRGREHQKYRVQDKKSRDKETKKASGSNDDDDAATSSLRGMYLDPEMECKSYRSRIICNLAILPFCNLQ